MSLFKHPHITRGIVKTTYGAFEVSRGIVEAPDAVGESLGWMLLDEDGDESLEWQAGRTRTAAPPRIAPRSVAY